MSPVLVTGTAGFIGYHLTRALLEDGETVIGLDSVNDYYSVQLKRDRLANLRGVGDLHMVEANLADRAAVQQLFDKYRPRIVVNLAAQAGVRHSLTNPHVYVESNVTGFMNILESCRYTHVEHLVYASSSSVYGANQQIPFSVLGPVDHPISIYAATKRANELMAHTYSHLYGLPTSGLRFFSVYGPWGRPDMALFMFTRSILAREPIEVFNNGELRRDFTYIDDIVSGIRGVMAHIPVATVDPDSLLRPDQGTAPYRVYNIGNNTPVQLMDFIHVLEQTLGCEAEKVFLPMQVGDVQETFADIDSLTATTGFLPTTTIETGIPRFVSWYRDYYEV